MRPQLNAFNFVFCSVHVDSVSLLLQFLGQLSAAHKAHSASLGGGGGAGKRSNGNHNVVR